MGIRFRCPNGHKLHVKDFLAGKRGICPKCGAKFQIPEESDPELAKDLKKSEDGSPEEAAPSTVSKTPRPAATQGRLVESSREELTAPVIDVDASRPKVAEVPVINLKSKSPGQKTRPAAAADVQIGVKSDEVELSQSADPAVADKPTDNSNVSAVISGPSGSSPSLPGDPINEAPHAVWYVRPPSGGQFGPASGDIMRSWIAEGRVTIESLVWREGWPEWKSAGGTFPGLLAAASSAPAAEIPQIVTEPSGGTSSELYRRRKSTKTTLSVVVLLIAACLILFGALVYVVRFMN